jgi:hypothetical protein
VSHAVEEELARVQQEIKRLLQEQETITRRQVAVLCSEDRIHHIDRERARLAELWQIVDILCQQEQRQEPPLEHAHKEPNPHPCPMPQIPIPPIHEIPQQPLPAYGAIDAKSPLADNLQLPSWPP